MFSPKAKWLEAIPQLGQLTIVVHSQQHNKVPDRELHHVKRAPDNLLPQPKPCLVINTAPWADCNQSIALSLTSDTVFIVLAAAILSGWQCGVIAAYQIAIELPLGPAQELQRDDEEDDPDTASGECAVRLDVPGAGEEAGVDGVPIPEHLGTLAGTIGS